MKYVFTTQQMGSLFQLSELLAGPVLSQDSQRTVGISFNNILKMGLREACLREGFTTEGLEEHISEVSFLPDLDTLGSEPKVKP